MIEGIKKFEELMRTDEAFQAKLKAAEEAYNGEKTNEAVFNALLVPLAAEYGITASYGEFKEYMEGLNDQELNVDEITQVAGGTKTEGGGVAICIGIGVGAGAIHESRENDGIGCLGVGIGSGAGACTGSGAAV